MGLEMAASVFWNLTEGLSLMTDEWTISWDPRPFRSSYSAMIPNLHPMPLFKFQCFYFGVERYLYIFTLQTIGRCMFREYFLQLLGLLDKSFNLVTILLEYFVNVIDGNLSFLCLQLSLFCVIFRNTLENPKTGALTPVFSKSFLFATFNM